MSLQKLLQEHRDEMFKLQREEAESRRKEAEHMLFLTRKNAKEAGTIRTITVISSIFYLPATFVAVNIATKIVEIEINFLTILSDLLWNGLYACERFKRQWPQSPPLYCKRNVDIYCFNRSPYGHHMGNLDLV